jgi:hypothetical protein
LVGGLLAFAAAAVVAALLTLGGGGDGSNIDGAVGDTVATETKEPKAKPKPQTLTEAELISQGDAICSESRSKFQRYRDPAAEEAPDVAYSRVLVGISSNAVEQFEALVPPKGLASAYDAYLASQKEVMRWDRDALAAAEAEDAVAYGEAREARDQTEAERKQLSEAVGFHVCSGSDL